MKQKYFIKILIVIRDLLFPKKCVDCGMEGEWWCKEHRHFLDNDGIWRCPICKVENKTGATCACCKKESSLDGVISLTSFFDPSPLSELLHNYKYGFVKDIENLWQEIAGRSKVFSKVNFFCQEKNYFVFIPLFPLRERWRGFNQAKDLAKIFVIQAKEKNPEKEFIVLDVLKRIRPTKQQAKLNKEQRLQNIKDAFVIKNNPPERIILVDDVFTTGATLQEAARICKIAGVKEVWALTLFRAE